MKYIQISAQTIFLFIMPLIGNAETTCLDKVKTLELKRNHAASIGGMWGYFEKNFNLKKIPVEAIQLDSRINKIFFLLSHLCETQNGIPLTPLAIYISKNLSNKGEDKFKDELLLLGKTPQQIKEWFEFSNYSENHASRTLINSEIQKAIDQSATLIMRYLQLTEIIPHGNSLKESFQKMKNLTIDVDHLLSNQPYLSQALEETSHFLYWDDLSEGDVG
ncbi:uncharacterized protein METZ01_LOCUS210348 [marine metagenome]|uniref:Uncharacterized protein n=1 Tax=marine metagenome TaxID=408172 RepID=A0A382F591_9ZZZZ